MSAKVGDRATVVIVGGGPAGLGTALMLAKRGWQNIVVLEKRASAEDYEPDKSFVYQIDGRGQKLTDLLGITPQLAHLGVPSTEFYFTLIQKDGNRKTSKLPIADPERKAAYWLPRASFMQLLDQEVRQKGSDSIQVFFQTECLELQQKREHLEILCQSREKGKLTFSPTLLVACDGINSIVRRTLHEWEGESSSFEMQQCPSPSAGLRYKVLTLVPQFPLSDREGDLAESTMAYGIRSTFKGRTKALSLGLLPLKNSEQPRTANIIAYPDHRLWQLESQEDVEQFLKQAFPQIPLDKMIAPEELARFAASKGGEFPTPQYCSGLYRIWGQPQKERGTAVVLFGDAVHSFPPDIGQGVNAALEDIYLFHEVLDQTEDNLSQALPLYESQRQEDIKALIRLVQISYPWQYNQDPLRKRLWSINFLLRFVGSRLFPFLVNPHSFLLLQRHELSYSEVLAKSNRTTWILWTLGGLTIALVAIASFMIFKPQT